MLRRSGDTPESTDVVEAAGLRLNLAKGTLASDGKTVELTRNEIQILACLMGHTGQIVSRADLIDALWDSQIYIDDNTLSVNMTRLRGKLAELSLPELIKTRRKLDYQVYTDKKWAAFILGQLLQNAVRCRGEGPAIIISAKPLGKQTQLTIQDNGIGIPINSIPARERSFWTGRALPTCPRKLWHSSAGSGWALCSRTSICWTL